MTNYQETCLSSHISVSGVHTRVNYTCSLDFYSIFMNANRVNIAVYKSRLSLIRPPCPDSTIVMVSVIFTFKFSQDICITNDYNIPQSAYAAHSARVRSRSGTKARKLTRSSFIPAFPATAVLRHAGSAPTKNASPLSKRRDGGMLRA